MNIEAGTKINISFSEGNFYFKKQGALRLNRIYAAENICLTDGNTMTENYC